MLLTFMFGLSELFLMLTLVALLTPIVVTFPVGRFDWNTRVRTVTKTRNKPAAIAAWTAAFLYHGLAMSGIQAL